MVSIKDVAQTKVNLDAVDLEKRLAFRVDQLLIIGTTLTTWEQDFVSTMRTRRQRGTLSSCSEAQKKTLLSIWQEYHMQGVLNLPPGMF